jgi:hypothetical protein
MPRWIGYNKILGGSFPTTYIGEELLKFFCIRLTKKNLNMLLFGSQTSSSRSPKIQKKIWSFIKIMVKKCVYSIIKFEELRLSYNQQYT